MWRKLPENRGEITSPFHYKGIYYDYDVTINRERREVKWQWCFAGVITQQASVSVLLLSYC
jgi:hypothetical protein